jgi:uncharacterized LabA/DUF88 family protein
MGHKVIAFADGENLVLRYQDMLKDGNVPRDDVFHIRDLVVWHPDITGHTLCDIARISFYQTVVGDQDHLDAARRQVSEVQFTCRANENDTIELDGTLRPCLFKKEKKSAKTKSVDINLTVDMMRHANNAMFDVLFLLSGDGDYLPLVEEIMRGGKQVWLAAFSKGLNMNLRFAVDEFFDLDEIFFEQPEQV